ncbi:MAG: hypothetical protein ACI9UV_003163, partial [Algoriphagus sp.]
DKIKTKERELYENVTMTLEKGLILGMMCSPMI